jgi:hypothetical protein
MLRLNKKAAAVPVASAAESSESSAAVEKPVEEKTSTVGAGEGTVSLLGSIGGVKVEAADTKKSSKKRTPGEIRIQKGDLWCAVRFIVFD